MAFQEHVPVWFWLIGAALTVWNAIGCYFCFRQFRHGAEAMGPATDYDRTLFENLPFWYNYCYALAVGTGTLGGIGLLLRSSFTYDLFVVSLAALVIQFGYLFATTDIIVKKGFGKVVPFPVFIGAVGVFAIWFAGFASAHHWLV